MGRTTIDFGIDLGTTNSNVAVWNGKIVDLIDDQTVQYGKVTPSAVWIDNNGNKKVGFQAKNIASEDPENAYTMWKINMGKSDISYRFKGSGQVMKPEELSAEILKFLRDNARKQLNEEINAAVITVPADFDLNQIKATEKAAHLAGFYYVETIMEPVSSGIAYGLKNREEESLWLVYDLGGGTFDAAIIRVHKGEIIVENHGGDKFLGGELIDWDMVNTLFVPSLNGHYALSSFERGNKKWSSAFAKLKRRAEEGRIALSNETLSRYPIYEENICQDENGQEVKLDYELKRDELDKLVDSYAERTIDICNEVLSEVNLKASDIEKIILVGGPTYNPLIRKRLKERFKIPLESSIDPLTVVSQGAAIHAGTRLRPPPPSSKAMDYLIELEYNPIDENPQPTVFGRVIASKGAQISGLTIEFIDEKSQWRSGKIKLPENGLFQTSLKAETNQMHKFRIELMDALGNLCPAHPEEIRYSCSKVPINKPTMVHSIGVGLENNEFLPILKKGDPLPAKGIQSLTTTVEVKLGQSGNRIRIPIFEGENRLADRNRPLGIMNCSADRFKRDMPNGSPVDVTLELNESRLNITGKAYFPLSDDEFPIDIPLNPDTLDPNLLSSNFELEKSRFERAKARAIELNCREAEEDLKKIDRNRLGIHIQELLSRALREDKEAANEGQDKLLTFKKYVDDAEENLVWPSLVAMAKAEYANAKAIADEIAHDRDYSELISVWNETIELIQVNDRFLLERNIARIQKIKYRILAKSIDFWRNYLEYLETRKADMKDLKSADVLIKQGKLASINDDIEALKANVCQLENLLPSPAPVDVLLKLSDVRKR